MNPDHDAPNTTCEQCGGTLCLLGQLGNLIHLRCRQCGWMAVRQAAEFGCLICGPRDDYTPEDEGRGLLAEGQA